MEPASAIWTLLKPTLKNMTSWIAKEHGAEFARQLRSADFKNIDELAQAIYEGRVTDGALITVRCRPARFTPLDVMFPDLFINGSNPSQRHGPAHIFDRINPVAEVLSAIAGVMTTWAPAGILPQASGDVSFANLFASDKPVIGVKGLLVGRLLPQIATLPAIIHNSLLNVVGTDVRLRGVLRTLGPQIFEKIGVDGPAYEELRQANATNFLDLTDPATTKVWPVADPLPAQLWGGLYAVHSIQLNNLERDPQLAAAAVVNSIHETFNKLSMAFQETPNNVKLTDILLNADGLRLALFLDGGHLVWHMDAELLNKFGSDRQRFRVFTHLLLDRLSANFGSRGFTQVNQNDLTVLSVSVGSDITILGGTEASKIDDPCFRAVRKWHQQRIQTPAKRARASKPP